MAKLAAKGTYVKMEVQVWYDKKSDNIHITSSDPDLPATKLHMTAKRGTQSDANLRTMLQSLGVPASKGHVPLTCTHCGK